MSTLWPRAKFGEFLRPNSRPYTLGPNQDANLVGMRLYGTGPFHRELKPAMKIAKKSHFVVKSGDVIYNKLFAWKGTFGIVSPELDGMFVSDKFPTYELDRRKVDESWLAWYLRYPPLWEEARRMSTGSAALSKLTLNPPRFLLLTMPLPSLDEQRRIAARIDQLAANIQVARDLRARSSATSSVLIAKATDSALSDGRWPTRPLAALLREDSQNGLSTRPSPTPPGLPILRISSATSRDDGVVDESDFRFLRVGEKEARQYTLCPGDLLACRFNGNLRYVGRFALYKGYLGEKQLYPDKLIRFRIDEQLALPQFVRVAMNSSAVREKVESLAATTAGNLGIAAGTLKTVHLPVPPPQEQRRIVAYLDDLQAKVDALKRLQAETAAELDALLPSILDKAFQGEL